MDDIAAALLAARAGGPKVPVADQAAREISISDAYAVQALVVPEIGAVGGWKVGAAGPGPALAFAPSYPILG